MTTAALPPLRADLTLHSGPPALDGAPTWTIGDPARNRYVRIDWPAFEMLVRWDLGRPAAVAAAVSGETTLRLAPDDVAALAVFLRDQQLTEDASPAGTRRLAEAARAARPSPGAWLVHRYLFFRVPLVRPDGFLSATRGAVAWLGSRTFLGATVAALLLGLVMIVRQGDLFVAAFERAFTPAGLVAFAVALVAVKAVHELGHAYTAKTFGCRVPAMGVAFMVLLPMLYTDVNAAWTLRERRRRLLVGAAGMRAELTVAAWATLAWSLLPEGPARQAAFVLAAVTWVSSLAINASPFMRFDGYFLLMDALEMPNLHARAFALARWWLRERLFGLGDPPPEPLAPGRRRFLIAFGIATWLYRLVVFLGIALLVYTFAFKALGVVLFVAEIVWLILLPIWRELRVWGRLRRRILRRRRTAVTGAVLAGLVVAGLVPWTTRIAAPAVLKGAETAALYLPFPARLERVAAARGDRVAAGDVLYVFAAPDITLGLAEAEARRATARRELRIAALDPVVRAATGEIRERLAQAEAEVRALAEQAARLTLVAPLAGTVLDPLPDLRPGLWLSPRTRLALVRADAPPVVDAYVEEGDLARFAVGAEAVFHPVGTEAPSRAGRVVAVSASPARPLPRPDAVLGSVHGGPLATRRAEGGLVPEQAVYRVRVALDGPPPDLQQVGRVHIAGEARSLFARVARSVLIVLVREWGT
ncbi:peptidase M50 [Roseospira navarrensis]|uniref:Peptidase M50 n=1 Tax=Roseospira navarrensis TaxID=140058 RepID=A0A7X1ZCR3_9PROT|nr:peptidase M50 [Roseospira navarrensis]MQX35599.1 peptidase M50 [Roseospira navarrensis]